MTHIAIALFFSLIFIGLGLAAQLMVKEYRAEIAAALRGQMPVRPAPTAKVRVTVRARPQYARAMQQWRAAA